MKLNRMREEMINSFIDCLKKDTIPWHRGWSSERPFNAVTNTEYHGANALWLTYNQQAQLYKDPRWCTFKQAQSKGWKIKQGSKGTKIEFWSLYDTEEKRKLTRTEAKQLTDELTAEEFTNRVKPVSNTYTVFNGEQIEGIPLYEIRKNVLHLDEFLYGRNKLIENMKVGLKEGGNEAFYSIAEDMIVLPKINQFDNEFEYITTFFHEAGHATGHVSRFNREMPSARGTDIYAREELRAEIASAFAAQAFGIDYTQNKYMENHEAYIQDYIKVLENEPNELFAAIKDAEKISDYLIEKGEFGLEKETEMSRDASFIKNMDTYVALHREYIEEVSQNKQPIVINGYGGPGAGKSTACMEITAALKKEGYNAEYVQEYAKELVYEKDMEMLDGSPEHQYEILKEQTRRMDRLYDQVDFIVTDSPVMLNTIYNKQLTPEYESLVNELQGEYINYSFFMERDVSNFEEEGRIHNLTESIEKDNEIKDMLQKNEIKYKTYNHENVNEIVNDAIDFYEKINEGKSNEKEVVRDAENIQLTGAEAARFRMAMKGQERALDMFMNDESIPEHIKSDSMAIGKEAEKYFSEGLSIGEVIMNHTQDIDNSCNIFNPAYTKNLLSGLYAKTNDEYRNLKELPNLWNERELVEISEGLAEQLINEQIPIASGMFALDQVDNPREFQSYKSSKFFVNENVLINACENGKVNLVKCEQVESAGFETGKYYTVSEYDFISREIDREYTQGNKYLWDRYKTQENIDNIKNPEEQKYIEPKTNKFKLILKGKEHSDGITFGEGKGGIVKQMSGKAFSDGVANAFKKDEQFRSFINKVKDVYEFENSKGIPKEFRTTTDDMEVINKDMLLTQHELISNMKQPEMKAPEQNVMDFFKNTGTTNTKARGMNRRMELEL
ncbi:zincin-like metallopeptidase domain-containing protein [uncultured Eubacterium sp.]|uniref:zincin-like metallopeptidase domain-containing protein n=1 Tax=uncultured Eubacterium sp. TaxID=165185 RepID=UPI00267320EF|nr:zincin-like metallopeptidase domain-containing protein [uncultured Eubacterium sp.]